MKSKFGLYGKLEIFRDGKLVLSEPNLILDVGKDLLLSIIAGDESESISNMAIGNGVSTFITPEVTDTSLVNEIDNNAISTTTVDAVNDVIVFEMSVNSGDYDSADFGLYDEEINEAALIFSDGTLLARKTFAARPFSIADSITYTLRWTVGFTE